MKASDLKPGQFFEFDIDKRKTRCRRTATGYEYIVEIPEEDFTEARVTPLAVTGWDDEPQSEWVVELEPGTCWLAPWDGDPGRTCVFASAKRFASGHEAAEALVAIQSYRQCRNARVILASDVQVVGADFHKPAPLQLREGASSPPDLSFQCVNEWVESATYEDLQSLCRTYATKMERIISSTIPLASGGGYRVPGCVLSLDLIWRWKEPTSEANRE